MGEHVFQTTVLNQNPPAHQVASMSQPSRSKVKPYLKGTVGKYTLLQGCCRCLVRISHVWMYFAVLFLITASVFS